MAHIPDRMVADPATGIPVALPLDDAAPSTGRGTYRGPATDDDYRTEKHGPGPRVMSADTLQGDNVLNDADVKLGELTHIMLDVPSGRVAYGVLAVGGFLGIGEKMFAIPWKSLRLDTANHGFRLDISEEKLKNAPGFDKDAWPAMADRKWAEEVHTYYDADPYWR